MNNQISNCDDNEEGVWYPLLSPGGDEPAGQIRMRLKLVRPENPQAPPKPDNLRASSLGLEEQDVELVSAWHLWG